MTPDIRGRLAGMRVLVIEDVTDIRDVFVILLRAEGASVAAVDTGREAAELLGYGEFDVILTDLGLPDIPGDVLVRQISTAHAHPHRRHHGLRRGVSHPGPSGGRPSSLHEARGVEPRARLSLQSRSSRLRLTEPSSVVT